MKRTDIKKISSAVFFFLMVSNAVFATGNKETVALRSLIPVSTAVYLEVTEPKLFFSHINQSMDLMGLNALFPGKAEISALLAESLQKYDFDLKWVNLKKPLGICIMGPLAGGAGQEPGLMVLVPLVKARKSWETIQDRVNMFKGAFSLRLKEDYLVLLHGFEAERAFPPQQPLQLEKTVFQEQGDVRLYFNFDKLYKNKGVAGEMGKRDFAKTTASLSGLSPGFVQALGKAPWDLLKGLEYLAGSLQMDKEGFQAHAQWKRNSGSVPLAKGAGKSAGYKDFLRYIPQGSLFSLVYDLDPDFQKGVAAKLINLMLAGPDANPEQLLNKLKEFTSTWGPRGALSMDFSIDPPAKGAKGGLNPAVSIPRLRFQLVQVAEVSDPARYLAALKELCQGQLDPRDSNQLPAPGLNCRLSDKQSVDGFSYYEVVFKIAAPGVASGRQELAPPLIPAAFRKLMEEKANWYLAFSKSKVYALISTSPQALETLKKLVSQDAYPGPSLEEDKSISRLFKKTFKDSPVFFRFSPFGIAERFVADPSLSLFKGFLPAQKSGLLGYMRFHGLRIEAGIYWGMAELADFSQRIMLLLPILLKAGQGP